MIQCCGSEAELLTQICRSISELAVRSLPAVGPAIRPTAPDPSGHTAPRMDVSSLLEIPHPIASVLSFFFLPVIYCGLHCIKQGTHSKRLLLSISLQAAEVEDGPHRLMKAEHRTCERRGPSRGVTLEMGHETAHNVAGEGRLKEKVEHRRTIWAALNATVNW